METLSAQEQQQVERGAQRFLEELQKSAPELVREGLSVTVDPASLGPAFLDHYADVLGDLANTRLFSNATQTLLQEESDPEAASLQSANVGGRRLGYFVLKAFHKRLCNEAISTELKTEIERAKKEHGLTSRRQR